MHWWVTHRIPSPANLSQRAAALPLGPYTKSLCPPGEPASIPGMPTLDDMFEQYMVANPNPSKRDNKLCRYETNRDQDDWLTGSPWAASRTPLRPGARPGSASWWDTE